MGGERRETRQQQWSDGCDEEDGWRGGGVERRINAIRELQQQQWIHVDTDVSDRLG